MEAHDQIAIVIAALNAFEPSRDDTDNLYRLYRVFEGFRSVPDRDRVAPAVFSLLERFPDAEFDSPGPLVHELEAIPGYLPLLCDSVRRQPTHLTVWMINRRSIRIFPMTKEGRGYQSYTQRLNTRSLQNRCADLRKIFGASKRQIVMSDWVCGGRDGGVGGIRHGWRYRK